METDSAAWSYLVTLLLLHLQSGLFLWTESLPCA